MSVQAITWAGAQMCGSPLAKLILLTLGDWADQEGVWLLNVPRLASFCEATDEGVEAALSDLTGRQHLSIVGAAVQMAFQPASPPRSAPSDRVPEWKIARSKRFAIYARDRHACVYCGSGEMLSLDHVVPRSKGGSDDESNLVAACQPCNSSKGNRDLSEWKGRQ